MRAEPVAAQAIREWAVESGIVLSAPATQLIHRLGGEMQARLSEIVSTFAR